MNILPFEYGENEIRIIMDDDGEPWFNANDICAALEFGNARQAVGSHVDAEDVQKLDTPTSGGSQSVNHINEAGLYALILGSTKESAKKFKRWVTHEVLPSIRKTGSYGMPALDVRDPAQLTTIALQLIKVNKELAEQIEQAKPKTQFFDKYVNADGLYGLQNAARVLGQGPNKFIRWLKQDFLFHQGGSLVPRVRFTQMGLFEVKCTIVEDKARYQTFVTPKGIEYLAKKVSGAVAA